MFNLLPRLFTKTAWEWLRPTSLLEGVHSAIKLCAESLQGAEAVANTEYNNEATGTLYGVCSVPLDNIKPSAPISGYSEVSAATVAGVSSDTEFPYFVTGLPEGLIAIGKSPDSGLLLLYTDFIRYGAGYKFRENPESYGTYTAQAGHDAIVFYYIGGGRSVKHQPQFSETYGNTPNKLVAEAVVDSHSTAACRAGIAGAAVYASAGISLRDPGADVIASWCEGNIRYMLLSTDKLVQSPATVEYNSNNVLVFPVGSHWYWMSEDISRYIDSWRELGLFTAYPELVEDADTLYKQMVSVCASKSMRTITLSHGELTTSDYDILYKYIPQTSSLHLVSTVIGDINNNPANTVDTVSVDTIYLLYTASGDMKQVEHTANSSPADILFGNAGATGCCRITDCMNISGRFLTGITSNGVMYGAPLTPSAKIYGIYAVIGGNTYKEDIIYGYCTTSPVIVGTGNEVISLVSLR